MSNKQSLFLDRSRNKQSLFLDRSRNKQISLNEVKHIVQLSSLTLTPQELKRFQKQLSDILDYFKQLSRLNADRVSPISQVTGLENVFREDKPLSSLPQEEVLSGTKDKQNGLFKVKAIFEET